jgi:hypothetical protein
MARSLLLSGSMFGRALRYAAGAGFAAAALACLSPTLPLPPPSEPETISADASLTLWTVRGACAPGAEIVVLNEATGRGAAFEDRDGRGRYSVELEGSRCDVVTVRQGLGTEVSAETGFVLQETTASTPDDPTACAP